MLFVVIFLAFLDADGHGDYLQKGIDIVKQACIADQEEKYDEAYNLYYKSLTYFMHAMKCTCIAFTATQSVTVHVGEKNERLKQSIRGKVEEYLARAEKLKEFLDEPKAAVPAGGVYAKKEGRFEVV